MEGNSLLHTRYIFVFSHIYNKGPLNGTLPDFPRVQQPQQGGGRAQNAVAPFPVFFSLPVLMAPPQMFQVDISASRTTGSTVFLYPLEGVIEGTLPYSTEYWVSWADGVLAVGAGRALGQNVAAMSYTGNASTPVSVFLSSGFSPVTFLVGVCASSLLCSRCFGQVLFSCRVRFSPHAQRTPRVKRAATSAPPSTPRTIPTRSAPPRAAAKMNAAQVCICLFACVCVCARACFACDDEGAPRGERYRTRVGDPPL